MNSRTNRLQYLLPRAFLHSFFLCLQFNNLKKLLLTLRSVFQKKHHKCCYRRTSSNVNTVKEICRWYRSQFNKFEKAWVRVEILYFDFRKTPSYQNIKSSKVVTFEICEIFSTISHTYGTIKPPWWAAISILWQVTKFIKKSHLFNTRHSTYTVAIKLRDDILKVMNKD